MSAIIHPSGDNTQTSVQTETELHFGHIDGFRAVAALSVLFGHLTQLSQPFGRHSSFAILTNYLCTWLNPVPAFIVISGFCLMVPVIRNNGTLKGGVKRFFWKRARRILPPYYIVLGLALILIHFFLNHRTGTAWDAAVPVTMRGLLTHLLLIQQLSGLSIYQFDPPMWSIGVEWWIYFLFPVFLIMWRRAGILATVISTGVFFTLSYLVVIRTQFPGASPLLVFLFVLGMAGALIAISQQSKFRSLYESKIFDLLAIWLIIPLWLLGVFGNQKPLCYIPTTTLTGLWAMSILITGSKVPTLVHRLFNNSILKKIGTFSYTLYLTHSLVAELFYYYVARPARLDSLELGGLMWSVGAPLCIAVAFLLYFVIEKPFITKQKLIAA